MANNTLSINKVVSIFRDLTIRHKQLQDFGYGPTYNIEARNEPMLFPYLWLDDIGSVIESTESGYKSMYYTFDLYVMDKINKGDSNYDETISDTNTILNQIFAEMSQHKYYRDMGLNLNGNITMEPVTEATNDNVNGWKATITLKQPYRLTACNVPIEPITGYTVSLTSNITEYRLIGATGPQGATGPAGEPGATGATGAGANVTADNGLTKTGDNIQLGGALTENTSITGNLWQLYFNPKTITIDTAAGDLNLYANTGDVNMSSTGDTSIGADGSLYFTTYTGASLYADAGDVNVNVNNGNFNVNAISGTVSLDGTVVNVNDSKVINLATASNPLDAVNLGQLSNTQKVSFGFGADGSGGTLLVGTPTYLVMDHSGTITQWDIVGNTAGTAIFDIWKSTNQTLPTVANTIVASAKPTVGSASYATSIGLTGWGVTYSAGDIYGFNIDSIAAFTKVNLSLRANKS